MRKNVKLTFCATMAALASVIMLTAYFPYLTYALPALAGLCVMAVFIETDGKWAFLTYLTSAVISFLLAESEAKLIYICLLGYYPILKAVIEKLKNAVVEWALKLLLFNAVVFLIYYLLSGLFGVYADDINTLGRYGTYMLLALANVVFVLYDICISRMAIFYVLKIQPKLKKMFRY